MMNVWSGGVGFSDFEVGEEVHNGLFKAAQGGVVGGDFHVALDTLEGGTKDLGKTGGGQLVHVLQCSQVMFQGYGQGW